jgi:glutamate--cysteine ligase catalytic subunit
MARAQKRAASTSNKFYFRKDVFATRSSASSVASSSGASSPVDGSPKKKPKKMENCFPPIPLPENGFVNRNVEEEYEEMTMDEIMNGKVETFFVWFEKFPF